MEHHQIKDQKQKHTAYLQFIKSEAGRQLLVRMLNFNLIPIQNDCWLGNFSDLSSQVIAANKKVGIEVMLFSEMQALQTMLQGKFAHVAYDLHAEEAMVQNLQISC